MADDRESSPDRMLNSQKKGCRPFGWPTAPSSLGFCNVEHPRLGYSGFSFCCRVYQEVPGVG
jgi:hypothetical protein